MGCLFVSSEQPFYHITRHIRQQLGRVFVVETEEVQDGGVEVVDVHRVFASVEAIAIRLSKDRPGLHAGGEAELGDSGDTPGVDL